MIVNGKNNYRNNSIIHRNNSDLKVENYIYIKRNKKTFTKLEPKNSKDELIRKIKELTKKLSEQMKLVEELKKENFQKESIILEQKQKIQMIGKILYISKNKKNNEKDTNILIKNKIIENKNKQIDELKKELSQIKDYNPRIIEIPPGESIIAVNFVSMDRDIIFPIGCLTCDTFVRIEEKLYEQYPELKEFDNNFLVNGIKIKRFKMIKENGIKTGQNIVLINN